MMGTDRYLLPSADVEESEHKNSLSYFYIFALLTMYYLAKYANFLSIWSWLLLIMCIWNISYLTRTALKVIVSFYILFTVEPGYNDDV